MVYDIVLGYDSAYRIACVVWLGQKEVKKGENLRALRQARCPAVRTFSRPEFSNYHRKSNYVKYLRSLT